MFGGVEMKDYILLCLGFIGSCVSNFYGGLSASITCLLFFMVVDYLLGIFNAMIFKKSDKTETGALSSKVGFKGIIKKCTILLFVLVGAKLDILIGVSYIKDGICIAFIVNELVSIIENATLIGVPIPPILVNCVDLLKQNENKKND